jgi:hypothetical protein
VRQSAADCEEATVRSRNSKIVDDDFSACSVDVQNGFFAAYRNTHSQGGTNTRQRNLHHLFKWLALRSTIRTRPWS